jgi:hypothetical protein
MYLTFQLVNVTSHMNTRSGERIGGRTTVYIQKRPQLIKPHNLLQKIDLT